MREFVGLLSLLIGGITAAYGTINKARTDSKPPLLLQTTKNSIDILELPSGYRTTLVHSLEYTGDVDYDYEEEQIFFNDIARDKIFLISNIRDLPGATLPEVIVNNLDKAQAIAYDWVHKVLYWTDAGKSKKTIELLTMKGRHRRTIVDTNLDQPGGIAIDPREDQGWVYWTDFGIKPKIERVGLDGSHRTLLVTTHIGIPFDLTIDFAGNRLYWSDSKYDAILSCELNGKDIRKVFADYEILSFAYSLDIFGDMVYWDDGWSRGVYEVNKTLSWPKARIIRRYWGAPGFLRIFHRTKQPRGADPCAFENGGCSHICSVAPVIGSSKDVFRCLCPDTGC